MMRLLSLSAVALVALWPADAQANGFGLFRSRSRVVERVRVQQVRVVEKVRVQQVVQKQVVQQVVQQKVLAQVVQPVYAAVAIRSYGYGGYSTYSAPLALASGYCPPAYSAGYTSGYGYGGGAVDPVARQGVAELRAQTDLLREQNRALELQLQGLRLGLQAPPMAPPK